MFSLDGAFVDISHQSASTENDGQLFLAFLRVLLGQYHDSLTHSLTHAVLSLIMSMNFSSAVLTVIIMTMMIITLHVQPTVKMLIFVSLVGYITVLVLSVCFHVTFLSLSTLRTCKICVLYPPVFGSECCGVSDRRVVYA